MKNPIPGSEPNSHGLRIGAVSYLNTKPLIYGLKDDFGQGDHLSLALPSRLADELRSGELDVALIPSIEYFQERDYGVISDACIACCGPVWSVKILFRVPPSQVQTLALDEGSRTSVALGKILLAEKHGISPRCVPLPIDRDPYSVEADALLIIGDRAMRTAPPTFVDEWDLGEEWFRWTGLPFVFAMWVAKIGACSADWEWRLSAARDRGLAAAQSIALESAQAYGISIEQCHRYLTYHLRFFLGTQEKRGLQLFYEKAVQHGLAPSGRVVPNSCVVTA
ncbi:MAG: menaquinone biosynthesis protein [Pirellulales bacterium]